VPEGFISRGLGKATALEAVKKESPAACLRGPPGFPLFLEEFHLCFADSLSRLVRQCQGKLKCPRGRRWDPRRLCRLRRKCMVQAGCFFLKEGNLTAAFEQCGTFVAATRTLKFASNSRLRNSEKKQLRASLQEPSGSQAGRPARLRIHTSAMASPPIAAPFNPGSGIT
jgi:hypothetical protein